MNKRLVALVLGTFTSLALLFANPVIKMSFMHDMMTESQCQMSCGIQAPVSIPGIRHDVEDKDIEPQSAEPYYLAFLGVGWTTVISVAAAYILKYLRWRPPDICKWDVAYRF